MAIRYVGFDLDGTLRDSMAGYTRMFGEMLHERHGIAPGIATEHFVRTAGQPTAQQVASLLAAQGIAIAPEDAFAEGNLIATVLGERSEAEAFPEVEDMLKTLRDAGYGIFVSSGHQERIVGEYLARSGLSAYVQLYEGVRPAEPAFIKGEPHFRAASSHFGEDYAAFVTRTIFVGDTPTDVQVARETGITAIARVGTHSAERLLEAGAYAALPDLSGLPHLLTTLEIRG